MKKFAALVVVLASTALVPSLAEAKSLQDECSGNVTVVFHPDIWEHQAEAIAGVEKALQLFGLQVGIFQNQPRTRADLSEEQLRVLSCVVEVNFQDITDNSFYRDTIAFVTVSVYVRLRIFKVEPASRFMPLLWSVAVWGRGNDWVWSPGGGAWVDRNAALIQAFSHAAFQIFCKLSPGHPACQPKSIPPSSPPSNERAPGRP